MLPTARRLATLAFGLTALGVSVAPAAAQVNPVADPDAEFDDVAPVPEEASESDSVSGEPDGEDEVDELDDPDEVGEPDDERDDAPASTDVGAFTPAGLDGGPPPAATYEIGAYLGLRGGGRVTPGGLSLGGTFLYQLTDGLWSDSSVGVTLAGTSPGCFIERDGDRFCDHGVFGGSGLAISSGLRVFFAENNRVRPYARAGVGLEYIAYGDDNLDGVAIPLFFGAGVRAPVDDRVFVGGGALIQAGVSLFDQDVGAELFAALTVLATVEFDIE